MYWWINIYDAVLTTDSDLNVVSGWGGQLYIEPRWWVEGATGASGTTPLSIPQGVTIWPENTRAAIPPSYARLTEIVLPHKWGNMVANRAPSYTGTYCNVIRRKFIKAIRECPDVLTGGAVCDTNAIDIISIDWPRRTMEGICMP